MNAEPREPSHLPIRGTIATAGTVGALALLMSFRGGPLAPTESAVAAGDDAPATDELVASAETQTSGAAASVEPATITGQPFETRWGDVQVEVTLAGSDITEVVALVMPDSDRHTIAISDYLEPILAEEAITYDTADVSVISGATYTSEAYAASLQSALDQAHEVADEPAAVVSEPEAVVDETSTKVRTATGEAVGIRWGDVQVAVTVEGGDVIEVETLAIPMDDRKSERINTTAEPILREEAITYDTADVSVISGATYTSEAYAASLQSALDQAHKVADEPAAVVSEPEAVVDETSTTVRTATGEAVRIRWGDVQVAVTVEGGDVIEVETLAIPMDDRKSERINTTAEPILREEAITYDTADVSVVSGATYTSRAYATSLQSALDQLGF